jgi:hypothetical protein
VRDILRLPSRMKGGCINITEDVKYPAFLGTLLYILPKCIAMRLEDGELVQGCYTEQMKETIGEEACDAMGHKDKM